MTTSTAWLTGWEWTWNLKRSAVKKSDRAAMPDPTMVCLLARE